MNTPYAAKHGDPIIHRQHGVVAYWAVDCNLAAPYIRIMPRLPAPDFRLMDPDVVPEETAYSYHEVSLFMQQGDFRVWVWDGEGDPEESLGGNSLFTFNRPEGDLAKAIQRILADRTVCQILGTYGIATVAKLHDYARYLEEGRNYDRGL
jgi:hypothetical protein